MEHRIVVRLIKIENNVLIKKQSVTDYNLDKNNQVKTTNNFRT